MKSLFLLRHAHAASPTGAGDHERELSERGAADAARVGAWMAHDAPAPELVLLSSARRAQATFERWREAAQWRGEVRTLEELYLASRKTLCETLSKIHDEASDVLLIGHNPGLSVVTEHLADRTVAVSPASVVWLSNPLHIWKNAIGRGAWELKGSWSPAELPD